MKRSTKISVIIPTYNESGNIVNLVRKVQAVAAANNIKTEIVVVDDNSPDKTGLIAKEEFRYDNAVRVYIRKKNRELATAILLGITKSNQDNILFIDADFNHNPKDIPKFISRLKNYDLVIGSRFIKGGGMDDKLRYYFTKFFNLFLKQILRFPTTDNLSGYSAIRRDCLNLLPLRYIYRGYGEYFLRLVYLAKKYQLTVTEVPVYYHKRRFGKSKSMLPLLFFKYIYHAIATTSTKLT